MLTGAELKEYLDEIRNQVCGHCPERPAGGPPCAPLGKVCGVEEHLEQLIASIRQVNSGLINPYLEKNRREICMACGSKGTDICPCPMDYLAVLTVQAVEDVDQRPEQWEWFRKQLACRCPHKKVPVEKLCRDYEETTGTLTGCD